MDYQTRREYDRYEQGAANSNTSTKILEKQLFDSAAKIIITTIQKLAIFIRKHRAHEIFRRVPPQYMPRAIVRNFKRYYMFGFTGTPIFALNAETSVQNPRYSTPQKAFEASARISLVANYNYAPNEEAAGILGEENSEDTSKNL